jgi:ParB/RepB/Spo0J family partition protein
MTHVTVDAQMIRVADIKVDEGHNPRKRFDEAAHAEMVDSLKQRGGVVQSVTVYANDDGGYTLVAGERRLRAARAAELDQIPGVIRPRESALLDALTENLVRADLDPIEEAEGLQRLAQMENLKTHKAIAKRLGGKSPEWVGDRLRLLNLPEPVQLHIAAGTVPLAAERNLRPVAEISPRAAEAVCELVVRGDVQGRDLIDRFGDVLTVASQSEFDPPLVLIQLSSGLPLSHLVPLGEKFDALHARLTAIAGPYDYVSDDPYVYPDEEHIDAARAAQQLIEHVQKGRHTDTHRAFLTDAELAADIAERLVEAAERRHAERKAACEAKKGSGASEESKAANRAKREKAKKAAKAARGKNQQTGQRMIARRVTQVRRECALGRARAVATMVLDANPNLPARGLRLVLGDLQTEEVKTLKSGETRRKVIYADPEKCEQFVRDRIAKAKSVNEILELMAEMIVAAHLADEDELPQTRRVRSGGLLGFSAALDYLAADVKAAKPARARSKRA